MSLSKLIIIYIVVLFIHIFKKKVLYTFKINGFEVDSLATKVKKSRLWFTLLDKLVD
jgi:hypothetical protein